jgi:hypothetical protein
MKELVPCPFVDGAGRHCKGHVVRIAEYYNSDIRWDCQPDGTWRFRLREAVLGEPASFYRLVCSEERAHEQMNSDQMKLSYEELGDDLKHVLSMREM